MAYVLVLVIVWLLTVGSFAAEDTPINFRIRSGRTVDFHLTFDQIHDYFANRFQREALPAVAAVLPREIRIHAPALLVNSLTINADSPPDKMASYFLGVGLRLKDCTELEPAIRNRLTYLAYLHGGMNYLRCARQEPIGESKIDYYISASECFGWSILRSQDMHAQSKLLITSLLNLYSAQRLAETLDGPQEAHWLDVIRQKVAEVQAIYRRRPHEGV
jgi:hypothetical protein